MNNNKNIFDKNYEYLNIHIKDWKRISFRLWWVVRVFLEVIIPIRLRFRSNILSVGSGMGQVEYILSKIFFYNVYMVDINPYAKLSNTKLFGKNKYFVANANKLPFKNNKFDLIISYDLMEHLKDKKEIKTALIEMKRVLKIKKGIRMFHKITVTEDEEINKDKTHFIKWSSKQWEKWFKDNNFKILKPTSHKIPSWFGKKIKLSTINGSFYLSI